MTTFGEHLRAAIKEAGINQRKLATAMEKSEAQVCHWARDNVFPSRQTAKQIHDTLAGMGARMGWMKKFGLTPEAEPRTCPKCGGTGKIS